MRLRLSRLRLLRRRLDCGGLVLRDLRLPASLPKDVQPRAGGHDEHQRKKRSQGARGAEAAGAARIHWRHADYFPLRFALEFLRLLLGRRHAVELRFQFRGLQAERGGVLAHEAAGEKYSRQALQVIGFDRLQHARVDLGGFGYLLDTEAPSQAFLAEPFPDGVHSDVCGVDSHGYNTRITERFVIPEISAIIVNWNRRELLRACLESLAAQECSDFETILVDNGSTDGSVEMVQREFGPRPELGLRMIVNSENRGFCAANNQGIAAARGRYVALLNNDAEAAPGWLAALRGAFDGAPDIGMAASKILVWEDPGRIDKAGHLIYPDGQNRGRGTGERDIGQYDRPEEALWPDGCAAMYKRAMLDEIGGFDEDFFAYGDDAELGLRARIAGWRCLYVPDAVVRHHRGATLGLGSARRLELIERNRVLLAAKLFPWSLLWLNGVYYAARVGAGAWAAMRGRGEISHYPGSRGKLRAAAAMLKGDLAALSMLPRILRKRTEVRRMRKLSPRELRALILSNRISLKALSQHAS